MSFIWLQYISFELAWHILLSLSLSLVYMFLSLSGILSVRISIFLHESEIFAVPFKDHVTHVPWVYSIFLCTLHTNIRGMKLNNLKQHLKHQIKNEKLPNASLKQKFLSLCIEGGGVLNGLSLRKMFSYFSYPSFSTIIRKGRFVCRLQTDF